MTDYKLTIWRPKAPRDDQVYSGASIVKEISEDDIYESSHIEITVKKDGAIYFSDGAAENFIYFYPCQINTLNAALKVALKQEREARKAQRAKRAAQAGAGLDTEANG